MSTSFPSAHDWKKALPRMENMVAQTLDIIEQKLQAVAAIVSEPEQDHAEVLANLFGERLHGFQQLSQQASAELQSLDTELAVDEERLRQQLNDMQAFRQSLTSWLDSVSIK